MSVESFFKAAAEADASKFETATEWILATEIPLIQLPVLPCGRSFDEFHHRHGDENYDPKKYSWIRAATMATVSSTDRTVATWRSWPHRVMPCILKLFKWLSKKGVKTLLVLAFAQPMQLL